MTTAVKNEAPVLQLKDVNISRNEVAILENIHLTVKTGEHWALIGPNGAGKSTIMNLCGAWKHPSSGTVRVLGELLGRVELQKLRRSIGHVTPAHPVQDRQILQNVVLTGLTGSINTPPRWEPTTEELKRVDNLVRQLGLAGKVAKRWQDLSQGERGLALIARALISQPQLLLLDEPTTGLDVAAREQFLDTFDQLAAVYSRLSSVLVTHHLEELPPSTSHAALLSNGRLIAAGPATEVITTELVSKAFEHPIKVIHNNGRWSARTDRRKDLDAI